MKKIKFFFITAAAVLFFSLPCFQGTLSASGKPDFDWYWMFYEKEKGTPADSFVIRPFYLKNTYEDGSFEASLMPVIFWRTKTKQKDEWKGLFGLFGSLDYLHDDGIKDYDMGVFPLVLYGKSVEKKDQYLLIWPVGGTMKGKLAQEEISAWVFPGFLLFFVFPPTSLATFFSLKTAMFVILSILPVWVTYKDKDYNAWAVLWPLIQRGKSSKRDEFRILPFYAHNYKKEFYDNYSILMIFNWRRIFYKDDELTTLLALPVIGTKWSRSGRISASTLLWPLFSWGYDKRTGDMEINMPWPIVQIQDSENPKLTKRVFFPIYGYYKYINKETLFFTPLYFHLMEKRESLKSEYTVFTFIIWYFEREYKTRHEYYGKSWQYFKIWPLFHVESNDLGDYSINFLSLLPMRDPNGYEKLYQPFWSIFEYRRIRTGEQRLGILMRTYYQRWGKDFFTMKISPLIPLFSYSDYMDRVREVSILFSMFGYENLKRGRYVRVFWIPLRIGEGDMLEKTAAADDDEHDRSMTVLLARDGGTGRSYEPHITSFMARGDDANNFRFTYHIF